MLAARSHCFSRIPSSPHSLTLPNPLLAALAGISKANEALILGQKLTAPELLAAGFFNRLFPASSDSVFLDSVMAFLREKLDGLDLEAVSRCPAPMPTAIRSLYSSSQALISKALIKTTLPDPDPR